MRRLNSTVAAAAAGSIHGERAARIIANKLQQRRRPQQQHQQQPLARRCARVRPRPPKGPRRSEARRPLARHHLLFLWRRKRSLSRSLSSTHSTLFLPLLLSLLLAFVPHSPCAMCALSSAGPLAATAASHTGGRSVGRAMPPRRPLRRAVDSPSFIGRPAPDARSVGFKPQTPLPQSLLPTVGESA